MRIEESVSFIFEGYRFFVMATRKMHASHLCYDEEKRIIKITVDKIHASELE